MTRHSSGCAPARERILAHPLRAGAVLKVRFEPFLLDTASRQLLARDGPRPLTPKAFALLVLLVGERPRAVSKQEILERLWPSTFVAESNVPSLVNELRQALGDTGRSPRYVRTVHRFGYAFAAEATDETSGHGRRGAFRLVGERQEAALRPGVNLLGRAPEAVLLVDHASVSRRHAIVRVADGQAALEDCGSKNGTYVRGLRVTAPTPLRDRDEVRLGRVRFVFRAQRGDTSTATAGSRSRSGSRGSGR